MSWDLLIAMALAGGMVIVMEMRHSGVLEGVRDQHSAEMAETRRMLADNDKRALQLDRQRAREVSALETRLALLEREVEKNAARVRFPELTASPLLYPPIRCPLCVRRCRAHRCRLSTA